MRAAMAFLTVIPVATHETDEGASGERLGRAYFPAVGALLGLLAGVGFALAPAGATPLLAGVGPVAGIAGVSRGLSIPRPPRTARRPFWRGGVATGPARRT